MSQTDKRLDPPSDKTAGRRRPYKKPRILYREPLEAVANVCAKGDAFSCSVNGGLAS